jgi:hypothetical protein
MALRVFAEAKRQQSLAMAQSFWERTMRFRSADDAQKYRNQVSPAGYSDFKM